MVIGNIMTDGFTSAIGSGTATQITHVFSSGTAAEGHQVSKFNLNIPGASADTTFIIYDGVSGAGNAAGKLSGEIPLVSLPAGGLNFRDITRSDIGLGFNTGSITILVKGNIVDSRTFYGYLDLIY